MTNKNRQKVNGTVNGVLGTLSNLDEFLINSQIQKLHPGTSRDGLTSEQATEENQTSNKHQPEINALKKECHTILFLYQRTSFTAAFSLNFIETVFTVNQKLFS